MERMLSKLEFMLMGLRQLTLSAVYAWFPELKKEDILEALQQSPKFKVEGNIVTLKSETELYEEELQKDILKDLMVTYDIKMILRKYCWYLIMKDTIQIFRKKKSHKCNANFPM